MGAVGWSRSTWMGAHDHQSKRDTYECETDLLRLIATFDTSDLEDVLMEVQGPASRGVLRALRV